MTTLDWVVGVFVTAAAWAALYRGLERAARQHDAAHAVSQIAQNLINLAKVEVDLVKAVGGSAPGGGFFNLPVEESRELPRIAAAPKSIARAATGTGS